MIPAAFAKAIGSYQSLQSLQRIDQQLAALNAQLRSIPLSDAASRAATQQGAASGITDRRKGSVGNPERYPENG